MRWPLCLSNQQLDAVYRLLPVYSTLPLTEVCGFPQYATDVLALPQSEQQKFDRTADTIAQSYMGRRPIVAVLVAGHADRDASRGRAFERQVSEDRASLARERLRAAVQQRLNRVPGTPDVEEIPMRAMGFGATQRVVASPATERDRARNRRIVIYLAEGLTPTPPMPALVADFPVPPQKRLTSTRSSGAPSTPTFMLASFVPALAPTTAVAAPVAFPAFVEGPSRHPVIHHDHGFLDDGNGNLDLSKKQPWTFQDEMRRQKWLLKLRGAQVLRQDLREATTAYSHFLVDHDGTPLEFSYEDFARTDRSGRKAVESTIDDTRAGALDVYDKKFPTPPSSKRRDAYSIRTDSAIVVGGDDDRYPYPETEDWQKAIGAHYIWLDASVIVDTDPTTKTRTFDIVMILHAEDMYNFNPTNNDIATGIPDEENGRFEIVGFGKEFLSVSTLKREIQFTTSLQRLPDNRVPPSNQNVFRPR